MTILWIALAVGSMASGGGGIVVAMLVLAGLSLLRLFSSGKATVLWGVWLVFTLGGAGLSVITGLTRDGLGGFQFLTGLAFVLTLVVVEQFRTHRQHSLARRLALDFVDRVADLDGVRVYEIEHAQPNGSKTGVSLIDVWTGQPGGPRSLWGSWAVDTVVAVDDARRVLDSTTSAGLALACQISKESISVRSHVMPARSLFWR